MFSHCRCLTGMALAVICFTSFSLPAQEEEPLQPTQCAPEGSLWFEFMVQERERFDSIGEPPGIRIELPPEGNRQGHVGLYEEGFFSEDRWLLQKHPIVDRSVQFLKPRGAEDYDKDYYGYLGLIVPPGSNNQLFPNEPELDTGRAGAIIVVPWYSHDVACEQAGLPGLLIHSGSMTGNPMLERIPSLVMPEDDLAQLIANIIAVQGSLTRDFANSTYAEVVEENAGWMGMQGFSSFNVDFETRERTFWEWLSGAEYGSEVVVDAVATDAEPQPLPEVMPFAELDELTTRIGLGYVWYMNEFERLRGGFNQQYERLQALGKPDPNSPQFREQIAHVSEVAGELITFLPEYIDVMRGYTAEDLYVSQEVYDEHMNSVEAWQKDLQEYQYQLDGQIVTLEKIDAAKYLDVDKEFDQPSLSTESCELMTQSLPIRQVRIPVKNHGFNASGRAGVHFVKDAPGTAGDGAAVRLKLKAALNVSQMRAIQPALLNESLPESSCSQRFKAAGGDELYADGRGNLNGKTSVRFELHACSTFSYPCWRDWKTYTCRKTASTRLLRHTQELGFYMRPTVDEDSFILRISGATSDRIELAPDDLNLDLENYAAIRQTLDLRPEYSFFSENSDGLWYVAQMQSKPLLPAVACSIQDRLINGDN